MEYMSQIDHLVEVLRFLLSRIPVDQYSDDVRLLKYIGNLQSVINWQSDKEEGELENDVQSLGESDNIDEPFKAVFNDPDDKASLSLDINIAVLDAKHSASQDMDDEEKGKQEVPKDLKDNMKLTKKFKRTSKDLPHLKDYIKLRHPGVKRKIEEKIYSLHEKTIMIEKAMSVKGPEDCFQYHCGFCILNFTTSEEQQKHDRDKHCNTDGNFVCYDCDFSSAAKSNVLQHFSENHGQKHEFNGGLHELQILCCQKCDQAFFNQNYLRYHMKQAHGLYLTVKDCLLCYKNFQYQKAASTHMEKVHTGSKVRCTASGGKCNMIFSTSADLDEHMLGKHERADQYTCHICGKTYSKLQRAMFNRHTESHSMGEPTFKCENCSKCFFFEVELITHMKKFHTTVFCNSCEYKSTKRQTLKDHIVSHHSKERPYKCTTCGKGFVTSSHLTRHKEIHEVVKKYECSVCGKKFSGKRHLTTHSKIHSKSYEAHCVICDKKFVQKFNMKLHMKKHHPEVDYSDL